MCARLMRAADASLSSAPKSSTDGYPSVAAALGGKAPGPKSRSSRRRSAESAAGFRQHAL